MPKVLTFGWPNSKAARAKDPANIARSLSIGTSLPPMDAVVPKA
jgi:hypothetical protein